MEEQAIRNIADVQSGTGKPAEQTQKPEDKLLPEHVMGPFLIREISRDNPQMEEGGFYRDKKTVQLIGASGTQKAMAAAMACGEMDGPAVIVAPSARDLRYWEMDLHFFMPERKCIKLFIYRAIKRPDACTFCRQHRRTGGRPGNFSGSGTEASGAEDSPFSVHNPDKRRLYRTGRLPGSAYRHGL